MIQERQTDLTLAEIYLATYLSKSQDLGDSDKNSKGALTKLQKE